MPSFSTLPSVHSAFSPPPCWKRPISLGPFLERLAWVGRFEDDLHPLPVALVQVVELVEVPEEPVLDGEPGPPGLAGDVGVGHRRGLAFALQLGEVAGVLAGVAERVARDVEVVAIAELGDVRRGRAAFQRRFVAVLVGFGQLNRRVAEHRVDRRRLVLLAVRVADFVPLADHQPRRVGLDQALFGGLAVNVPALTPSSGSGALPAGIQIRATMKATAITPAMQ